MMPFLTALVLAGFAGYGAAWYVGLVEGNFALLLFLATVVTGLYWIAERLYFLPRRRRAAERLEAQDATTPRRPGGARHHPGRRRGAPKRASAC